MGRARLLGGGGLLSSAATAVSSALRFLLAATGDGGAGCAGLASLVSGTETAAAVLPLFGGCAGSSEGASSALRFLPLVAGGAATVGSGAVVGSREGRG